MSSAEEVSPDVTDRVAKLIEQLEADTFSQRQAAEEELIKIGPPALEALRSVLESPDSGPETLKRGKRIIGQIRADVYRKRVEAFVAQTPSFVEGGELPSAAAAAGWEAFLEIVGENTRVARELYGQIITNDTELIMAMLEARSSARDGAGREAAARYLDIAKQRWQPLVVEIRTAKAKNFRERLKKNRPFRLSDKQEARLMAFAFCQTQLPNAWIAERVPKVSTGLLTGSALGHQNKPAGRPGLYNSLRDTGPRAKCLRRLLAAWCQSTTGTPSAQYGLQVAMTLYLKDVAVEMAEAVLAAKRRDTDKDNDNDKEPGVAESFLAIHALMLWGRETNQVRLVEPYLEDDRDRRLGAWRGQPARKSIFLREWAMMALTRMTGQGPTTIGKPTTMTSYCNVSRFVKIQLYTKEGSWKQALSDWQQWSEKNLPSGKDKAGKGTLQPGGATSKPASGE